MKRILLIVVLVVGVLAGGAALFVTTYKPARRPVTDLRLTPTPEMLARGDYLFHHVLACADCHSQHDWSRFAAPIDGPAGAGGECWNAKIGFPGNVCAPNLTSDPETGLGNWTDDEILRAVREGIDKDGNGLAPIMPYTEYIHLADEDAHAVVAYVRTLPPVRRQVEAKHIDFPVSFFFKLAPKALKQPVTAPPRGETAEYGAYLTSVAGCQFCHTPQNDQHQPDMTKPFAGGNTFETPHGPVNSSNLTPAMASNAPKTRETFIQRFRDFQNVEATAVPVVDGRATVMPWLLYAHMADEDLGAIFLYLQTVKPVEETVEKYPRQVAAN